jgi:predicted transcriptional regulator
MAKSFRLDPDLERRLEEAAAREGVPASALIRDAVRRRCDEVLGGTLLDELGEIVGAIDVGGDQSRRTGEAFAGLLQKRRTRHRA